MFRDLTSLKIQSYTQKLVLSAATHQQQKYVSVCYILRRIATVARTRETPCDSGWSHANVRWGSIVSLWWLVCTIQTPTTALWSPAAAANLPTNTCGVSTDERYLRAFYSTAGVHLTCAYDPRRIAHHVCLCAAPATLCWIITNWSSDCWLTLNGSQTAYEVWSLRGR